MADLRSTIKEVAAKLIGNLNIRNRDVVSRRFGLKTGEKETLESIGHSYGITRERVRQIEEVSLKQIREIIVSGTGVKVKPLIDLAENILEQNGGVLKEEDLLSQYFTSAATSNTSNKKTSSSALLFVLAIDGRLIRSVEDDNFHSFWGLSEQHAGTFRDSVGSLVRAFTKAASPIEHASLTDFSKKVGISSRYTSPAALAASMSISKEIGKNIFGHVGLNVWPEIKPRGVRDKSYLVLKKEGKPKHFREITQLINLTFSDRKANTQTVHNELIKDKRFVLVGRGLYGLAEWGCKAGTVKDVLVDLLRSSAKPVKRDELVNLVLTHRLVKENTILLNLQDSKTFKRTEDGAYTLIS